ncbi:MAG: SufS family cysteine desulfurase [Candidatus Nanoarchaeia archaeon]
MESELRIEEVPVEPLTIQNAQKIVLGSGKKATVIVESAHEIDVEINEDAELTLVELDTGAKLRNGVIRRGGKLVHNVLSAGSGDIHNKFRLVGEGAELIFNQAVIGKGKAEQNIRTDTIHSAKATKSTVSTKSVVQEQSKVVSYSNMLIERVGQQSISQLDDHSLILSGDATAESVPGMEVEPADVQAGHAASTSQINSEHLFYLMSRGLTEDEARKTIVMSFLGSVLGEHVNAELIAKHLVFEKSKPVSLRTHGMRRSDFPIFSKNVCGKSLVYLDSAATTQKPLVVIEAMRKFYVEENANIHRGLHTLSERATEKYEESRRKVANFIGADAKELIFVRNATEGLNLLAQTIGKKVGVGDIILLTEMEHHSNIVPWQLIAKERGAEVRFVGLKDDGSLDMDSLKEELKRKPKIVSVVHVSNVLGVVNPVKEIISQAHEQGAIVVIDGAQSATHMEVDVKDLGCDAFVLSGHKMMGPTGIGAVYIRKDLLRGLPPYMGGGGMIKEVTLSVTTFKEGPEKYEAGTPNVAGAIGLARAVDYLQELSMPAIEAHNKVIINYALTELRKLPQITIYGSSDRAGSIAFNLGDMHPHDVSTILDEFGVAMRAGHHCAQPLMERMNMPSMCRASFHCYNSTDDVNMLITGLKEAIRIFKL